jgi:hypothetical protein
MKKTEIYKPRILFERGLLEFREESNYPEKIAVFLFRFYFVNLPPYNTLTDNNRPLCELK